MIFGLFKKKVKPIITDEDSKELREIERKSYMEYARKLMEIRGKERARIDLEIKQKKDDF